MQNRQFPRLYNNIPALKRHLLLCGQQNSSDTLNTISIPSLQLRFAWNRRHAATLSEEWGKDRQVDKGHAL